ncbi:MAG: ribonuclease III [Rhodocyclaceae bacterium]|nr:ribonuclease III [Rhodocyclaceae bacterium]
MTERLEERLGHRFTQPALLRQALTHRSHSTPHNERLEFLGDALLNCVIAALLYERFPQLREGDLSRLRASLVRKETLAELATELEVGDYLRLGEGELKSGGFRRPSILADALEAMLAALYLDAGFAKVEEVVRRLFAQRIAAIDPERAGKDAKTALQEWLQGRRLPLPLYTLRAAHGAAHAQEFEVACEIPALKIHVVARGASRRAAEQAAARLALDALEAKS